MALTPPSKRLVGRIERVSEVDEMWEFWCRDHDTKITISFASKGVPPDFTVRLPCGCEI